jgi:hypothetical protein
MKVNRLIWLATITILAGPAAASGCSSAQPKDGGGQGAGDDTAQVSLALTGGVFDGNSVLIVGHRSGQADGKYPCVSDATGCFNFAVESNGFPEPADEGANAFAHLCPTVDVNAPASEGNGTWTFTYTIFNAPNCQGNEVTGHNFDCFAPSDLAAQAHPNQTFGETLPPGDVTNTLLCPSMDTQKSFGFHACELLGGFGDILDCGCVPVGPGVCNCPFDATPLVGGAAPPCMFTSDLLDPCDLACGD